MEKPCWKEVFSKEDDTLKKIRECSETEPFITFCREILKI